MNFLTRKINVNQQEIILKIYQLFFFSILIYTLSVLYIHSQNNLKDWTFSDWLINYQDGGFKRRGLLGSLYILAYDYFKIPLWVSVYFSQAIAILIFFYNIYKGLFRKKIDAYFISLLFLPFALPFFFMVFQNHFIGRKEILMLAFASYFVLKNKTRNQNWFLLCMLFVGILIHEMVYFYLPFFIYYLFKKEKETNYKFLVFMITFLTIEALIIFFYSAKLNEGNSLEILKHRGVIFENCNIFTYFERVSEFDFIKKHLLSHIVLLTEFLVSVLIIIVYAKKYLANNYKEILVFISISLIWISPLFYLVIDWLRFFFIYFMLMYFTIWINLANSKENKVVLNDNKTPLFIIISVPILIFILYLHVNHDYLLEILQLGKIDLSNSK